MAVLSRFGSPIPKILPTLEERLFYDLAEKFASIIGVDEFKFTLVKYDDEMWYVSYNKKDADQSISIVLILYETTQNEDGFGNPIPVVRICYCNIYPTSKGMGTKLFKTFLEFIQQTDYRKIIVTPSSDRAKNFWLKMGFTFSVGNMILDLLPEREVVSIGDLQVRQQVNKVLIPARQ